MLRLFPRLVFCCLIVPCLLTLTLLALLRPAILAQTDVPANYPPDPPLAITPYDGAEDVARSTELYWVGSDPDMFVPENPDQEMLTFTVALGTTEPPPVVARQAENWYRPPAPLRYDTQYFWQITATDRQGASTAGPVWLFTTEVFTPTPPAIEQHYEVLGDAGGMLNSIASGDGYVFMSVGQRLVVADVTSPNNPTLLGATIAFTSTITGLAVRQGYVYVAHAAGLSVVDARNLGALVEVDRYPLEQTQDVLAQGNLAFVLARVEGLVIYDISIPQKPVKIGHHAIRNGRMVAVTAGYAVIPKADEPVLEIVDISDPATDKANLFL